MSASDESELAEWRAHFPGKTPTQVIEWIAQDSEDRWERTKLIAQMAASIYTGKAASWKKISDLTKDDDKWEKLRDQIVSGETKLALEIAQQILAAAEAAEAPPAPDDKCVGLRNNHRWGDDGVCLHCGASRPEAAEVTK